MTKCYRPSSHIFQPNFSVPQPTAIDLSGSVCEWKGKSLKFGIGVGVGYLEVEGDIILTNLEDGSQEKHDFDVSTDPIDLAAFVMMDVRYNKWLLRISGGGPWIVNWNDEDGYEFGLFDISM